MSPFYCAELAVYPFVVTHKFCTFPHLPNCKAVYTGWLIYLQVYYNQYCKYLYSLSCTTTQHVLQTVQILSKYSPVYTANILGLCSRTVICTAKYEGIFQFYYDIFFKLYCLITVAFIFHSKVEGRTLIFHLLCSFVLVFLSKSIL